MACPTLSNGYEATSFQGGSSGITGILTLAVAAIAAPIRVVVWDERQEAQKSAYGGF